MSKYLTECIGTFFLVLTIGLTVTAGSPFAPLAIGATLMVMVYMGGPVSGGHYNPAVTLGVALRRAMPGSDVIPYWIAQIAGALVAALTVRWIVGMPFAPAPGAVPLSGALLIEILFTFALVLVVLNTAVAPSVAGNSYYGLAIGFTIVVAAFAGGPISGGAFNPAVGIGPIVVDTLAGGSSIGHVWLYIVGPLLGGALGAVVHGIQFPAVKPATP